jgi:hypothetical protein
MARAARLLGALEGPYRNVRYLLSPLEREEHARCLAEARAALGEAEFAAQYAAGQADGLARVAAEALARTAHVAQPGG